MNTAQNIFTAIFYYQNALRLQSFSLPLPHCHPPFSLHHSLHLLLPIIHITAVNYQTYLIYNLKLTCQCQVTILNQCLHTYDLKQQTEAANTHEL